METLIHSMNLATAATDEATKAAAELLSDYASAVPDLVDDIDTMGQFELGLVFDVMPQVQSLLMGHANAEIASILARTPTSIAEDFAVYADTPRQFVEDLLVAGPDYREVPAGGEIVLDQHDGALRRLSSNDWRFYPNITFGGLTAPMIDMISIAPANVNHISVEVGSDGVLRIKALPGFRGLARFDYRVRDEEQSAIGRAFVRVH